MATWIFQGNPKRFDIEGYLAAEQGTITWLVRQHRSELAIGDTVFLWQSEAGDPERGGIVAECRVASLPAERAPDPASLRFWIVPEEAKVEHRVDLVVLRIAGRKEMLRRRMCIEDPLLKSLPVLKQAQGTNFRVEGEQVRRLRQVWERIGTDWTWRDAVAGLWAFHATKGHVVSMTLESPVARVAFVIGRAVGGVYNKVMNFRHLDPTDPRTGMSAGGEMTEAVWAHFFDAKEGRIDSARLDAEVKRLSLPLGEGAPVTLPPVPAATHGMRGDLEALVARYTAGMKSGALPALPQVTETLVATFVRNPLVVAIAKQRAEHQCEIPSCKTPTFLSDEGTPFCEVHHIQPLSEGGLDTIENAICLCAQHHRQAHYGTATDRAKLRVTMAAVRRMGKGSS